MGTRPTGGTWKVWLVVEVHRVYCPRCGVCGERIDILEGKHRDGILAYCKHEVPFGAVEAINGNLRP